MLLSILISAVVFGCAAFLGMQLAAMVGSRSAHPRVDDDPRRTQGLVIGLTLASAMIGGLLASRNIAILPFATLCIVCACLCAAWYSDVHFGFISDYFTLAPLAVVYVVAVLTHAFNWYLIVGTLVGFLPFGLAALVSKGKGMGWGDSKLAALGGALLGFQTAILLFAAACLLVVGIGWLSGKRAKTVAFAPYLAVAIVIGLLLRVMVSPT
jgi:prepilin signal peptidase PulO-like enzyme (type II secretory pathway)